VWPPCFGRFLSVPAAATQKTLHGAGRACKSDQGVLRHAPESPVSLPLGPGKIPVESGVLDQQTAVESVKLSIRIIRLLYIFAMTQRLFRDSQVETPIRGGK
ncbi:hypothetical protein, partial [Arthrobacter gallicola]|uniref:hypothetical protein n=1 Tax=Arthrobacter gallicola TaxID=2762225 RepID=UPI001CD8FAB7